MTVVPYPIEVKWHYHNKVTVEKIAKDIYGGEYVILEFDGERHEISIGGSLKIVMDITIKTKDGTLNSADIQVGG